ncbi:MAG: acyltransferase [bacterium]|nr:acyltransferase [bacterium]
MKQKLPPEESKRLSMLRFPLIVAVVFIHANNDRIGMPDPEGGSALYVHWLRRFLSEGLAAVAVPLFFLISGYLFFAGWDFSTAGFMTRLKSRIRTLLIPYLFWNIALALVLALATQVPQASALLSGKQGTFIQSGPLAWISAIGGFSGPPVVYQFWFLRDLMVAVCLVPVFHLAHRFLPGLWLVLLGIPWFTHSWPLPSPSAVGPLFFFLGSWIAVSGKSLFALDRAWPWILPLHLGVVILGLVGGFHSANPTIHQVGILLGVLSALCLSSKIAGHAGLSTRLVSLTSSAFLVFAVHEPILTILRRLSFKAFGSPSPSVDLLLYFALPTIAIVFAWAQDKALRQWTPRLAALVSGGR